MSRHLPRAFIVLMLLIPAARVAAQSQAPAVDNATCLACHADASMAIKAGDGGDVPLHVPEDALAGSVHAKHNCVDCHKAMAEIPHPAATFASRRSVTVALSEACRTCHFANYTKTLDSVHQKAV